MAYRTRARRVWDQADPIAYAQMSSSPAMQDKPDIPLSPAAKAARGGTFDPSTKSWAGGMAAVLTPEGSMGGPVTHVSDIMLPIEGVASAEKEECAVGDIACLQRNAMRALPGAFSSGGPQSPSYPGGDAGGFGRVA